jgi:hypothetical protein
MIARAIITTVTIRVLITNEISMARQNAVAVCPHETKSYCEHPGPVQNAGDRDRVSLQDGASPGRPGVSSHYRSFHDRPMPTQQRTV